MTPTLHDLMHDAVRDAHPDLRAITETSRRRGLAIRRRRQALAVVGAAAAVAVLALGASRLGGEASGIPAVDRPTLTPSVQPTPSAAPTGPTYGGVAISGRLVTSALYEAVSAEVDGDADNFRGQPAAKDFAPPRDSSGGFDWHPADGSGVSVVEVEVQPAFRDTSVYRCTDAQVDCRVTHPTRGTTLMTFEVHRPTGSGTDGIRAVADLLRPDGLRVRASATNGYDLGTSGWKLTRAVPVLDREQLTEVVALPTWGAEMDARFTGRHLDGYSELGRPTP